MDLRKICCLVFAASRLASAAWGMEATGRITYLSADHKQLMLDNSRMFTLMKSSESRDVAVGERVDLKLEGTGSKQVTEIKRLS